MKILLYALRELEEETGYSAKKISLISKFLPTLVIVMNGFM
ncbi:MAG: hypothetical protein ACLRQF_17560 [Thomasclavelia ramosa]